MLSSIIILIVVVVILIIFYKRDMLLKMFSLNVTSSTNQFQQQLEQTADIVIKRLEEQIIHLEYLLEEANEKTIKLDEKIQIAQKIVENKTTNVTRYLNEPKKPLPDKSLEEVKAMSSNPINNIAIATNEVAHLSIDNYKELARNDKRNSIIAMADDGYDITEIAQATGISKGEIMLLLQLNKK